MAEVRRTQLAQAASARPLRADAARNRRKIIDAARELFAVRGLEITLDDVADHAGVGVGTVYRRFKDKHELIDGIFGQRLSDIEADALAALEVDDGWQGFVTFMTNVCEAMSVDRGLADILLGGTSRQKSVGCSRDKIDPLLKLIVERAHASGQLRPDIEYGDIFVLLEMAAAASDFCCRMNSSNWHRYFVLLIESVQMDPALAVLPGAAPTEDEINTAKRCTAVKRAGVN